MSTWKTFFVNVWNKFTSTEQVQHISTQIRGGGGGGGGGGISMWLCGSVGKSTRDQNGSIPLGFAEEVGAIRFCPPQQVWLIGDTCMLLFLLL